MVLTSEAARQALAGYLLTDAAAHEADDGAVAGEDPDDLQVDSPRGALEGHRAADRRRVGGGKGLGHERLEGVRPR